MRLSDVDIEHRLEQGSIAIEPAPGPDSIAGISVDLRLDHRFRVFSNNSATHLDLSGEKAQLERDIDRIMSKEIEIAENVHSLSHEARLKTARVVKAEHSRAISTIWLLCAFQESR